MHITTPNPTDPSAGRRFLRYMPFINRPSWLQVFAVLVVAVILLPVAYLALSVIGSGQEGLDYLLRPRTLSIITNSITLTIAVTLTSTVIGVLFAWLTARTDLPFRRVFLVLGLLTIVMPSYLVAVTFVAAFGPVGMLRDLLQPFGVQRLPDIYGFFGAWLSITLFTYPYIVLPVRAALRNSDRALEEAGRSLGLNRWQVFLRITLPQLRPAIASGVMLTALYTLSDFGAVAVMRYNAFTRAIFLQIDSSMRMDRAAILSIVLIIFTLILLVIERRIRSQTINYRIGTGVNRQPTRTKLGVWKIPAVLFCTLIIGLGVFTPVLVMLSWTFTPVQIANPLDVNMAEMTRNTLSVSGITALVTALVALPLAVLAVRHNSRTNRWLIGLTYTGNILPGIVIALALVYFAANYANPIYQTLPLLVIGYMTRFLPFSIGATISALTQINPRLEEAARSMGLTGWQVARRVTIPLARTGIIAGAALVFLSVMKELPTTLILRPIGFETFAVRIWAFYNDAFRSLIGLPGLFLLVASGVALIVVLWRDRVRID